MKKNNAVVFGLTSNHVFAVACVMMDLKRLCETAIHEVVIFHDGIRESDQQILKRILPTQFITYEFPIKNLSQFHAGTLNYFSKMVYTKFECLRLLDHYKNVLWLDYDIVVQRDISELFQPSSTGFRIMRSGSTVGEQLHYPVSEYDMNALGVSSGTFSLHDNLSNYLDMYQFCYEALPKFAPALKLPEQAILDFMIQEFRLELDLIPIPEFSPHPSDTEYAHTAKIIHAYGQPKFWNGIHNQQWEANYKRWIEFGGSQFTTPSLPTKAIRSIKRSIAKWVTLFVAKLRIHS